MRGGAARDDGRHANTEEVVLEQNAARLFLVRAIQQREEQRVVQHEHIGGEDATARALKKADSLLLAKFRRVAANLRRAKPPLGADVRPDLRLRLDLEAGDA